MEKVTFLGKVLPEHLKVSLPVDPGITWGTTQFGPSGVPFRINVENSRVSVSCETQSFDSRLVSIFYSRALEYARAAVDVLAFCEATDLTVVFESYVRPDGTVAPLFMHEPTMKARVTSCSASNLTEALLVVYDDAAIFLALQDLLQTISSPHRAPFACPRAMEGIRDVISPNADVAQRWPLMCSALNIDPSYLTLITTPAEQLRHSEGPQVTGATASEIMARSWTVMDRFIQYRKGGSRPLADPAYPALKG